MRELRWAIKSSFLSYVVQSGQHLVEGDPPPVEANNITVFRFPLDSTTSDEKVARFTGEARISAHGGMLNIRLCNPWLEIGNGARLTVESWSPGASAATRTPIAEIQKLTSLAPAFESGSDERLEVVLAREAVDIFDGVYPTGTVLDPLLIVDVATAV